MWGRYLLMVAVTLIAGSPLTADAAWGDGPDVLVRWLNSWWRNNFLHAPGVKGNRSGRTFKISHFNADIFPPVLGTVVKHHASGRHWKPFFDFQVDGLPEAEGDAFHALLQRHLDE